ncbi:GPA2 [[Candida] subhashii]|uniref:GPA2 n=1 Tax=[Candida] subhashii TaxID=561895 RepID=A0A8J5QUW4_9ASCO|nr:GPA2 [[Candida] subhashii]KAG7666443.1 GPA2 [[Candida] subhashii]
MGSCASKEQPVSKPTTTATNTQAKRQQQQQSIQNQSSQPSQPQQSQQLQQPQSQRNNNNKTSTSTNGTTNSQPIHPTSDTSASLSTKLGSASSSQDKHPITQTQQQQAMVQQLSQQSPTSNGNNGLSNNPVDVAARSGDHEVKVLLLGSGESGKSTIVKQMKIIHQDGYSEEELIEYKPFVYKNVLDCIKSIIVAIIELSPELVKDLPKKIESDEDEGEGEKEEIGDVECSVEEEGENEHEVTAMNGDQISPNRKHIIEYNDLQDILQYEYPMDSDLPFNQDIASKISTIYQIPEVKYFMIHQQANFYLIDSTDYFLSDLSRITDPNYIPSTTDILRTRKKTSGIFDFQFDMGNGLNIHMYDVGGQRSERKKWIHCFDNVTLIIFCVALSEYDQVLLEENNQNRLEESLALFDSVVNSRWFARTSVVLFLNKIDVFAQKLQYSPLENHFPDYNGGNNINKAAKYILWRFNQVNRSGLNIYPHVTQAIDTSNIQLVMAAVKETILENSLRDSGFL